MSKSTHPLYIKHRNMVRRCHNKADKSYQDYGERGIEVCKEWLEDYQAFMDWSLENGWKPGLEIDRIDNDKGYSPDNCQYITAAENRRNRKKIQRNNISGFRGVSKKTYRDKSIRWVATVFIKGKNKVLGTFEDPELAALVRDEYIIRNNLQLTLN